MKKKNLAIVLALVSFAVSGCGKESKTVAEKKPVTINVWNYYSGSQQEAFQELVNEFNKEKGKSWELSSGFPAREVQRNWKRMLFLLQKKK